MKIIQYLYLKNFEFTYQNLNEQRKTKKRIFRGNVKYAGNQKDGTLVHSIIIIILIKSGKNPPKKH